jgi:hypothetical protein
VGPERSSGRGGARWDVVEAKGSGKTTESISEATNDPIQQRVGIYFCLREVRDQPKSGTSVNYPISYGANIGT